MSKPKSALFITSHTIKIIMLWLKEHPRSTYIEIAKGASLSDVSTRVSLRTMEQHDMIKKCFDRSRRSSARYLFSINDLHHPTPSTPDVKHESLPVQCEAKPIEFKPKGHKVNLEVMTLSELRALWVDLNNILK